MNIQELNSFKLSDAIRFHDKLNPRLFRGMHLDPIVKKQLLIIAKDFISEMGVTSMHVKDITISGSNAAYTYTEHSDLDLHILVDMSKLSNDEVYRELFSAKKTLYNESHDITIRNIPVELYVQDSNEPVISVGEYSLTNNKWIRWPTKRKANFDQTATKAKYDKLAKLIEVALHSENLEKIQNVLSIIKRYRQAGLDKAGEFGPENLAFKMLRSQGAITKLYDLRNKLHSQALTIETMYQINESIQIPMGRRGKATIKCPNYLYHNLRGRKLDKGGNIQGYSLSPHEKELMNLFPELSNNGYVWLSTVPYVDNAIKIDATRLDSDNLRFTGQQEGFLLHRGMIPNDAIVTSDMNEPKEVLVTEIERLPGRYVSGKADLESDPGKYPDDRLMHVPGNPALKYSVSIKGETMVIRVWNMNYGKDYKLNINNKRPGKLIAMLKLVKDVEFPSNKAVGVEFITVDEKFRKLGLARFMYGVVLKQLKYVLIAGDQQTPGGRRNWVSINQIPGIQVRGYVAVYEQELTTTHTAAKDAPDWDKKYAATKNKESAKNIDIIMGKLGAEYIGQARKSGPHYFAFDVVPNVNGKELEGYVKTRLSKVYGSEDYDYGIGLYAVAI